MAGIKTIAGFAVLGVVLASGVRSERQFNLEEDTALQRVIEQNVRQFAAGFDPKVALTMPELKDFSVDRVRITRSRAGALVDSTFGKGDQSYDAYVRFRESGAVRCMTLDLEWRARSETWKVTHTGAYDRCDPVW